MKTGKLIQAQQMYQQLLETMPVDSDLWHRLGILYWQQNQFEVGKKYVVAGTELSKKSPMLLWLHCRFV